VRAYFIEAHPVSLARNLLTIGFDPEFAEHIALVDNTKNHTLLQTKLKELGYPHVQVKFIQAVASTRPPPEPPAPGPLAGPEPRPAEVAPAVLPSPPPAALDPVAPLPPAAKTDLEAAPPKKHLFTPLRPAMCLRY